LRSRRRRPHAQRAGFTLLEVMIAIGLMTLIGLGLTTMQSYTIRSATFGRESTIASQIAQQWMERLKQDAHVWVVPSNSVPAAQAALRGTRHLYRVTGDDRGQFRSPDYVVADAEFVSNVYDSRGTPLPQANGVDAQGVNIQSRVHYCVSYRTNWVHFGRSLRAEVRVWWPREGRGANPTADFAGWCFDDGNALNPGGVLEPNYHILYLSTVIRMTQVLR
jgi:prepilin-type N-terminal cleavage/methylation domain-containing protein